MSLPSRALAGLLAAVAGASLAGAASAGAGASVPAQGAGAIRSPWYLERGPATRALEDPVLETAVQLASLLRDGNIPGFYDGQFESTRERFDELAAIATDPDMNHTLRVMAAMALQEAGSGAEVAAVLETLLVPPQNELNRDSDMWRGLWRIDDPAVVRDRLRCELSEYARFALAKDGQPQQLLAKIEVLEHKVRARLAAALDPSYRSRDPNVGFERHLIFKIGYHYQQFDDFENAVRWFSLLTDNLPGHAETEMAHYNLACIASIQGRPEEAIAHLRAAHAVGFSDVHWMEEDGDLAPLRGRADYRELVALMRNEPVPGPPDPDAAPSEGGEAGASGSEDGPDPDGGDAGSGEPGDPREEG